MSNIGSYASECGVKVYVTSVGCSVLGKPHESAPHPSELAEHRAGSQRCSPAAFAHSLARIYQGAIVPPAKKSNHLAGHAIDMNLQSASGFFNSSKLKKSNFTNLPIEIKDLISLIKNDAVLRWGGDFNKEDPVHIDDKLNLRNKGRWDLKFSSRQ